MKLLQNMTVMGHERVAFHQDPESGLRAIIAIHDTTLGNALGGTRRWCYASEAEGIMDVLRLSEGMTYKAAAADLAMGGAKSVILLDTRDVDVVTRFDHHTFLALLPHTGPEGVRLFAERVRAKEDCGAVLRPRCGVPPQP